MRVIVADDSLLFREGLVRLLTELDFEVVGQTDNAEDLVRRVGGLKPDVAIVDIRMPPTHTDEGLRAAREIGEQTPETGVLVLSQYIEAGYAQRLLEDGSAGRGYLLKDRVGDLESFAASVRRVAGGGSVVDPEVISSLVHRRTEPGPLDELTERELEILGLMAEGRSNAYVRDKFVLSPRTVESHVRAIFRKLELPEAEDDHRRVLAVLTYLQAQT